MKNKIFAISVLVAVMMVAGTTAYAVGQQKGNNNAPSTEPQQPVQTTNPEQPIQAQGQGQQNGANPNNNQPQNQTQEQNQIKNQGEDNQIKTQESQNNKDKGQQQGQANAEQHRSVVANFVQSLQDIANREGGLGEQIRTIAQQQNQSSDTTVQAMEKVQTRSQIKTFFFGSDYKNLGTLKSEMTQTQERLQELNTLMESIQNESDKTELQNQIQTLEQEQAQIEQFINNNENKFSLFGWAVRLFNK